MIVFKTLICEKKIDKKEKGKSCLFAKNRQEQSKSQDLN
jgi:hypothetical protein